MRGAAANRVGRCRLLQERQPASTGSGENRRLYSGLEYGGRAQSRPARARTGAGWRNETHAGQTAQSGGKKVIRPAQSPGGGTVRHLEERARSAPLSLMRAAESRHRVYSGSDWPQPDPLARRTRSPFCYLVPPPGAGTEKESKTNQQSQGKDIEKYLIGIPKGNKNPGAIAPGPRELPG